MNRTSQNESEIKILVVDDVEVNLIILEEIIKNMGYEALLAQRGSAESDPVRHLHAGDGRLHVLFHAQKRSLYKGYPCDLYIRDGYGLRSEQGL